MTYRTKAEHLDPKLGPKRILSLDGGGVRGILTLAYLTRLESILRDRHGDPNLRLSDYFDLIGGTSTGAIIAAALALGYEVDKVTELYKNLAADIFQRRWWRRGVIFAKYTNRQLEQALRKEFRDLRLESNELLTGLMVMTKRVDSGSPWPLANNPNNAYWDAAPQEGSVPNRDYRLWRVVRASTAAPHFFAPEKLDVGRRIVNGETEVESGQFIDGGVTTANNPALQLLQMAAISGYGFGWDLGAEQLLIVSVGTAKVGTDIGHARGIRRLAAGHAGTALLGLMDDCADLVETMMQWMSTSPTARSIDGLIGTLSADLITGEPLLTYLRYNVELDEGWMAEHLELHYEQTLLEELGEMDDPAIMGELWDIGEHAAARQLADHHLPPAFNLT